METSLIDKALQLAEQIAYHDDLFFNQNESEISDSEYDLLKVELLGMLQDNLELEKELNALTGKEVRGVGLFEQKTLLKTVEHHRPFISLRRTYDFNQFSFYKKMFGSHYIETKLDGLAIELIYRYGELTHVLTKGTANLGEDVTHNKRLFKSLPRVIEEAKDIPTFDIRCEAHLTFKDIDKLKESGVAINKQRGQVSGWIRSNEPNQAVNGMITLSAYEFSKELAEHLKITTGLKMREWLTAFGFTIPELVTDKELLEHARNKNAPFDGYIMKANDFTYHEKVDRRNEAPLSAIAFKYNTLFGETEATGVVWSVNKAQIVPRLVYKETIIDNSRCTHANLFNAGNFLRRKLGAGDKIRIVMGGDCVPHLSAVIEQSDHERFKLPTECPCCKGPVSKIGPTLVCNNTEGCTDILLTTLKRAVSKEGLDIRGLGPTTLEEWVGEGLIRKPVDLYSLEQGQIPLRHYEAIQNSRRITLSRFIYALCIDDIGAGAADELSEKLGSIENFLDFIKDHARIKKTLTPAKALGLLKSVSNKEFMQYLERFANALTIRPDTKRVNLIPIVITGAFDSPRNVMAELLLKSGIEVVRQVTKKTKCVLVGARDNDIETGSMKTAQQLGIPMIFVTKDTLYNDIVQEIKKYV